ncbi:hypothetical protein [Devosia sp. CAU 1758]
MNATDKIEETAEERSNRIFTDKLSFYEQLSFQFLDDVNSYPVHIPGRDGGAGLFGNNISICISDGSETAFSANIPIEANIILVAQMVEAMEESMKTAMSSKLSIDTLVYSRITLHKACLAIQEHASRLDAIIDQVIVDDGETAPKKTP